MRKRRVSAATAASVGTATTLPSCMTTQTIG